ncbi:MAG: hypothetical protein WBX25_18470 [Rhodomicrobium sp.]
MSSAVEKPAVSKWASLAGGVRNQQIDDANPHRGHPHTFSE